MLTRAAHVVTYLLALLVAVYASLAAVGGSSRVVTAVLGAGVVIVLLLVASAGMDGRLRRQWPTIALVALAATGLAIAGLIVSLTADTSHEGGLVERVCRPEGQSNRCQQAFQSRWASVPLGLGPRAQRIPVIVLGVAFYSTLLVWFVAVGRPTPQERWCHLVPLCMTAAGAGVAAYFTAIMYTRLAAPCPLCLASHIVTGVLFIATALAWPWGKRAISLAAAASGAGGSPVPGVASWQRPAIGLALAVMVGVLGIQVRANRALQGQAAQFAAAYGKFANDPDFMRWDLRRQPVVPWSVQPDDSVRGPASAPHVVITYSDFQCPQCYALVKKLAEVEREFPRRLRVVYRHFPLDRSCNPQTTTYMHAFSCEAARAAEAARRLGGDEAFWKMHDALYAHRTELDAEPYVRLAGEIGLDPARFASAMKDPQTWQRVKAHAEGSTRFEVASTPAVFLDGRRVRLWGSMVFWKAVLSDPTSMPATSPTTTRAAD